MKTLLTVLLFLCAQNSGASENSLAGTVEGLSIPNSHVVTQDDQHEILRGRTPNAEQLQELIDRGVKHFLIFKIDVKGEVQKEIESLRELGVNDSNITHLPFPWKDIQDFKSVCEMTITALQALEAAAQKQESLYFHCTAGEDRTGYLASLWQLWSGSQTDIQESFQTEMCARGYEAGNPGKPYRAVVAKIRESLTPAYIKMLAVLSQAKRQNAPLDLAMCATEPAPPFKTQDFHCRKK